MKPLKNSAHCDRVAALGCRALSGMCGKPAQIHHLKVSGIDGRGDWYVIGLCANHHTGENGFHQIGRSTWEMINGKQIRLHERVMEILYG